MNRHQIARVLFPLFFLFFIYSTTAMAANISYSITDMRSEQDNLWQIDYQVSNFDSDAYDGLQIFFEYGLYENIEIVESTTGWDAYEAQPEDFGGYTEDGYIDALILSTGGILSATFSVQAVYLGEAAPGSQLFELYNSSNWDVYASGETSAAPVPGSIVLLFSGLAGLCAGRRKLANKQ